MRATAYITAFSETPEPLCHIRESDTRPPSALLFNSTERAMTFARSVGIFWSDGMPKPRLLDLFCGGGGAAVGYARAGFEVVGIDSRPQKRYPFEFQQADALGNWWNPIFLRGFNAIHASPPCQAYSVTKNFTGRTDHPDLLAATRDRLMASGMPWVIENVPGAPMRPDYKLCGCMFGLRRLKRERWFETSWQGFSLRPTCHHPEPVITVAGHDVPSHQRKFGRTVTLDERKEAMGIDWMGRDELGLAIPPAYTEYIGLELLRLLENVS